LSNSSIENLKTIGGRRKGKPSKKKKERGAHIPKEGKKRDAPERKKEFLLLVEMGDVHRDEFHKKRKYFLHGHSFSGKKRKGTPVFELQGDGSFTIWR